jgi:hypothetical protein
LETVAGSGVVAGDFGLEAALDGSDGEIVGRGVFLFFLGEVSWLLGPWGEGSEEFDVLLLFALWALALSFLSFLLVTGVYVCDFGVDWFDRIGGSTSFSLIVLGMLLVGCRSVLDRLDAEESSSSLPASSVSEYDMSGAMVCWEAGIGRLVGGCCCLVRELLRVWTLDVVDGPAEESNSKYLLASLKAVS